MKMSKKDFVFVVAVGGIIIATIVGADIIFDSQIEDDDTSNKIAKFDDSEVCWFDSIDENYKDNLKMGFTIVDNSIYVVAQSDETHIFNVVSDNIEVIDNFIVVEGCNSE